MVKHDVVLKHSREMTKDVRPREYSIGVVGPMRQQPDLPKDFQAMSETRE